MKTIVSLLFLLLSVISYGQETKNASRLIAEFNNALQKNDVSAMTMKIEELVKLAPNNLDIRFNYALVLKIRNDIDGLVKEMIKIRKFKTPQSIEVISKFMKIPNLTEKQKDALESAFKLRGDLLISDLLGRRTPGMKAIALSGSENTNFADLELLWSMPSTFIGKELNLFVKIINVLEHEDYFSILVGDVESLFSTKNFMSFEIRVERNDMNFVAGIVKSKGKKAILTGTVNKDDSMFKRHYLIVRRFKVVE